MKELEKADIDGIYMRDIICEKMESTDDETGAKDISKAAIETVIALARTLGCAVDDIV